ncbi:MAG: DUF72 domain-containing protein [Desulfatiglandaceae bacterium]
MASEKGPSEAQTIHPEAFRFRDLHPLVSLGTASDRYAGWMGQIYSKENCINRIKRRIKRVGGKSFVEEVLPVESVGEYFQHFRTLELDFTFYNPLLGENDTPTGSFHALRTYRDHLKKEDRLILKAPQIFFARKIRKGNTFLNNENYLNVSGLMKRFYEPVRELLDPWLDGIILEQEYQRKDERVSAGEQAQRLDSFFTSLPGDHLFHVELRTQSYLAEPVFAVLERHGVGQVLSHWTWLPSLKQQFAMGGGRFLNAGRKGIIRLMTPRGVRYEDAYARAHPFDKLVDGMMSDDMIRHTVEIMKEAVNQDTGVTVIVNNRAGGNAPLIAREVARQFLKTG